MGQRTDAASLCLCAFFNESSIPFHSTSNGYNNNKMGKGEKGNGK